MAINLILSLSADGYIGNDKNDLCVKSSVDLNHFKSITNGHTVIMGLNTFKSLPKDLPNRRMVIVSSTASRADVRGHEVYLGIPQAIYQIKKHSPFEQIFIIGGLRMFEDGIHLADNVYLTQFDQVCENGSARVSLDFLKHLFYEFDKKTMFLIDEESKAGNITGEAFHFKRKQSSKIIQIKPDEESVGILGSIMTHINPTPKISYAF